MKLTQKLMDEIIIGASTISKLEIAKALAPVQAKVTALEVENATLREALAELREQRLSTAQDIARRYDQLRVVS
jgi:prefoldin subunit 5